MSPSHRPHWDAYKLLIELWENESKRLWTIFSLMAVANGVMISAVVSKDGYPVAKAIVCVLGVLFCFLWALVQSRICDYIGQWQKKLQELEAAALEGTEVLKLFRERKSDVGLSSKDASWMVPVLFMFGWLGLFGALAGGWLIAHLCK